MIWNRNKGDRNNGELIRRRIVFYGWVQGVGFRWRAVQAASKYGVTGWVRNEYDGSVSMEIQGTEEEIDQVVAMINQGRYVQIDSMEVRRIPLVEDEREFRSRY